MIYHFEDCALDVDRRELQRHGTACAVEPQVLDLLIYLLKNRDRAVSRHDIFQVVRRGRLVSDSVLGTRINAARQAIGDDGTQQRLIRTIYGSGYRFVGTVEEDGFGAGRAITAAANHRLSIALPDAPSVVAFPFTYVGADRDGSSFCQGLTEEIVSALHRLDWLFVISRDSFFRGEPVTGRLAQLAHQLDARYLLHGSVRQSRELVRVTVKLVDAAKGHHLWVETYDREVDHVLRTQQDLAQTVSAAIGAQIFATEHMRARFTSREELNSWQTIVRALVLMNTRSKPRLRSARDLLKKAIAVDPKSAPTLALLSFLATLGVHLGWHSRKATQPTAFRLAEQAVALNDGDAWAHVALGYATLQISNRPEEAKEILQHALTLNPNLAFAHYLIALASAYMGKPEQSFRHANIAERLGPHDLLVRGNAGAHDIVRATASFVADRYGEDVAFARKAIAQTPGQVPAYRALVTNYAFAGEIGEAGAALRTIKRLAPNLQQWLREFETTWSAKENYRKYVEAFRMADR